MDALYVANTTFTLDLFKKFCDDKKNSNIFFSPLSISSALAMVLLGARGNTAVQMAKALHFDQGGDVHSGFQELTAEINKMGTAGLLKLANRLFGEKTYNFSKEYMESTKKFYAAELEALDFITAADPSRIHINTWVKDQTAGKIENLLGGGTIDSLTRLVLVNAIYFKCDWARKFQESNTQEKPFRISKNANKPVKMMFQKAKFNMAFIPEMQMRVLELPYANQELSMFILLPLDISDDSTGLEQVEKNLTYTNLVDWTNPEKMDNVEVMVHLPRFKLEENYDLKPVLMSMGMTDAFSQGQADFSGMSDKNDLILSQVVHKSFVEVNEEGTEAAAATAAVMMLRCAMRTMEFNADHPFIFFIKHNKTRSILFYGKFCLP